MTTIYLIRHGQASFGAESYDKLSEKGVNASPSANGAIGFGGMFSS